VALLLKPNTALFVPLALLFTGRRRALLAFLAASAALSLVAVLTIGPHGISSYLMSLAHVTTQEARGASQLTLATFFGLPAVGSVIVRVAIAVSGLALMYRYRREPGMALAVGAVVSLLLTTYLHESDLCLFGAAGWIVWHERNNPAWRAVIAGLWVLATPFLAGSPLAPALTRWVACELFVMAAFAADAWGARPAAYLVRVLSLTGSAASRGRATA
jgi:hypothetical protein